MAEAFSFELKLIDSVSRNADKAADAVRRIEESAGKAKAKLDFSKDLQRTEQSLGKLKNDPGGYKKLLAAQKELAETRKKFGKESFTDAFKDKLSFGRMFSAAFLGDLFAEGLIEAIKKPIEMLSEGIKKAFEEGAKAENTRLGYRLSLGATGGRESLEDISRFSKLTGFDDSAIAGMMLPLRRAGFSQQAARTAFSLAGDISAGNGKGGDMGFMSGILDTLTNIQLKGGVNEKRLVSMGVNAPEFYKALSKKLSISTDEAKRRAGDGKINPQLLINTIGDAVEKQQGGKLGTGMEAYSKTLEGRWGKILALPGEYLKKVSESDGWAKLSDRLGKVLEQLDPDSPRGQKIIASLLRAFDKMVEFVDKLLAPENLDKFTSAIENLPETFNTILTIVEAIAAAWAGMKIASMAGAIEAAAPTVLGAISGTAAIAAAAPLMSGDNPETEKWNKEQEAAASGRAHKHWWGTSYDDVSPNVAPANKGGGAPIVNVNVQPGAVNIQAAQGDDPEHTHQKAAQEISGHLGNELGKLSNQRGAS